MLFPLSFIFLIFITLLQLITVALAVSATMEHRFPKLIAFDLGDYMYI